MMSAIDFRLLATLIVWAVAATVLAFAAVTFARGASSSLRSSIWNAALAAAIMGPALSLMGPRIPLRVTEVPPSLAAVMHYPGASAIAPVATSAHSADDVPRSVVAPANKVAALMGTIWLLGALLLALRYAAQLAAARALIRRSTSSTDPRLSHLIARIARMVRYHHRVYVGVTTEIDIPVATGLVRPAILLPEASADWGDEQLEMVLIHELAHLARGDTIARTVSMAACAIHWFNPMVWIASQRAMKEAEMAADDMVVNLGVRPSSYADTLLDLVTAVAPRLRVEPATAFISRSMLAARIHRILHEPAGRASGTRAGRTTFALAHSVIVVVIACVQLQPLASAKPDSIRVHPVPAAAPREPALEPIALLPADSGDVSHTEIKPVTRDLTPRPEEGWITDAIAGLTGALNDSSANVRGEAARALGRFRAPSAIHSLQRLLGDPSKFVREQAADALRDITPISSGS